MKHIKIILLLLATTFLLSDACTSDELGPLKNAHVQVTISGSSPVFSDSLVMMAFMIQAQDISLLEKIEDIPDWWKYVNTYYQTMDRTSGPQITPPGEVHKASLTWQFRPGLKSPLEDPFDGIVKAYGGPVLRKTMLVDIPAYIRRTGSVFITFGTFDTREAAKNDK